MPDLTTEDKAAIKLLRNDFDRYRELRKPFERDWARYDRLYHMTPDKGKNQVGRANLVVVDAFEGVETIVPKMVGQRARFTFAARKKADINNAQVMTDLCDYQQEQMDVELKCQDVYRDCTKFGTGISFLGWKQSIKKIIYEEAAETPEEKADGTVTGEFKKQYVIKKVIYDDPWEEYLSIWQVWTDPYVQNTEDQHSFVIVRVKRKSWAVGMIDEKVFRGNPDDLKAGNPSNASEEGMLLQQPMDAQNMEISFKDDELDPFGVVYERWSKDRVITTWNNQVVLRDIPNPFAHGMVPILNVVYTRVAGCWYGKGAVAAAEPQIQELTDHRNNLMDDANARAHSMWIRKRGSEIDDDQLISKADGVIDVNNRGDIEEIRRQPADQSAYGFLNILRDDIKRALGLNDYAFGNMPSKRVTSGEVATASGAGASRLEMPLMTYENMYVKRKGLMMYKMNQQFLKEEKTYRVTGKSVQFKSISPTDIQGDFDVMPIPGSSKAQDKAFKRNDKLTIMNILRGAPFFNAPKFVADMLKNDFDFANSDDYIIEQARPKQSSGEAKLQAQAENMTFLRTGYLGDPCAGEDHAVHNTIHEVAYNSPEYQQLPPELQERFKAHVLKHDDMMQGEAPATRPEGIPPPGGGPGPLPIPGPGELQAPEELPAAPAIGGGEMQ